MESLKVTYSSEADALLITDSTNKEKVSSGKQFGDNFIITFLANGDIEGVEIINASSIIKKLQNTIN